MTSSAKSAETSRLNANRNVNPVAQDAQVMHQVRRDLSPQCE